VYYQSDFGGTGSANYLNNIETCTGIVKEINPNTPPSCPGGADDPGCMNIKNGRDPVGSNKGAQFLIDADPGAKVDANGIVTGSCVPNCTGNYAGNTISPRIVPVALFDPSAFAAMSKQSGNQTIPIINIMAFFIQSTVGQPSKDAGQITGVLVGDAAMFVSGGGSAGPAAFLQVPGLIR
jgi:hypothetical protein